MSVERRFALVCLGLASLAWNGWAADRSDDDKLWAFQRARRTTPPAVHAGGWGRNPVDAYLLSRLERAGLREEVTARGQRQDVRTGTARRAHAGASIDVEEFVDVEQDVTQVYDGCGPSRVHARKGRRGLRRRAVRP